MEEPLAGCQAPPRLWREQPASRSAPSASTSPRRSWTSPDSQRWSQRSHRRSPCSRGKSPQSPHHWRRCILATDRVPGVSQILQSYNQFWCWSALKCMNEYMNEDEKMQNTLCIIINIMSLFCFYFVVIPVIIRFLARMCKGKHTHSKPRIAVHGLHNLHTLQ